MSDEPEWVRQRQAPPPNPGRFRPWIWRAVFTAATYVASFEGVTDGAVVATIVSYMRLVVIPTKQFGLVGGRFILQGVHAGISSFADVRGAALLPCAAAGLIAATLSVVLLPADIGWLIAVLTLAQLALEPRSGVTYALAKVVLGPRRLIGHLVTWYLMVLPIIWAVLIALEVASGAAIWASIFAVRCGFALSMMIHLKRVTSAGDV